MFSKICLIYLLSILPENFIRAQLIYVHGGVFKFIAGIGLPIKTDLKDTSLSWFTNIQVMYELPNNATYFEPYKITQKRSIKNTFNRLTIYQGLNKYFERLGIYGKNCIQKLICESCRRNLTERNSNFLHDILNILFSPNRGQEPGLEEYVNAQWQATHNTTDCDLIFSDCHVPDILKEIP